MRTNVGVRKKHFGLYIFEFNDLVRRGEEIIRHDKPYISCLLIGS